MIENFLQQLDFTQILLFVITTVGSGLLVWYRKQFAVWRAFWRSVLDGLRAIPELKADVKGIRYYVAPNGGGSLMDSVKRTEAVVSTMSEQIDLMALTMRAENDSDEHIGRFYTASDGEYTYVNQQYARWLGVGKAELLGWGYFGFIHHDDVDRIRRHWDTCRSEHRLFKASHRMVTAHGDVFEVDVLATPIPEAAPAKRWIGTIRKVENDPSQHSR